MAASEFIDNYSSAPPPPPPPPLSCSTFMQGEDWGGGFASSGLYVGNTPG